MTPPPPPGSPLRLRAEERLRLQGPEGRAGGADAETAGLIHELQIRRMELEILNEELEATRVGLETDVARYKELYDFAPAALVGLDVAGVIRQINLTGARLLGGDRSRFVGRPFRALVEEADVRAFDKFLQRVFTGHARQDCELTLVQDRGAPRLMALKGFQSADGQECRMLVTDIAEQKRAREALRDSERFARGALDALSANIAIVDSVGDIVGVNGSWREFARSNGTSPEAVSEGVNYIVVCEQAIGPDGDTARAVADGIRSVLAGTASSFLHEYPCHAPNEERWFQVRVTPFPPGGPARAVIAHENITGRYRAQLRLQASRERLQFAVTAGRVGLWDWDLRTKQVKFSRECKSQIGYDEDEISDDMAEWRARCHSEDVDRVIEAARAYLKGDEADFEVECRLRHKDGSYRNILVRASEVRGADGARIGLVGLHLDITERVALQAQFLHAQKMETVGRLAGGIAHDFNNLLTVINGTAEVAIKDTGDNGPLRADLEDIRKAGERAASLTRQLLAFSRKQVLKPEVVDISALVVNLRGLLGRVLGEDIELVVVPSEEPACVMMDATQMEQVVMNLAVNARDAMPSGGTLSIETRNDGAGQGRSPQVMVVVRDFGMGMDESTRKRVFEPFFTTKGRGKGTGLGLSTVYGIIQQTGGDVAISSEPGKGTTFTICLPRVDAPVLAKVQRAPPVAVRGTETILVVEDDVAVRQLVQRILNSAGYRVIAANNAAAALALLGQGVEWQLILTDVVMPGVTGWELVAQIREARPKMRALFTSGYSGDAVLPRHGFDARTDFVAKPFSPAQLARKVRDVLDA